MSRIFDNIQGLIDNATASRLKTQFAAHLREQITLGIPTGQDEAGLRRLARQLRAGQVVVKLFLPYPLHAKLYLLFRDDVNNPITGFVGSSNLTLAGLSRHGELNVDVLDHLGTEKLSNGSMHAGLTAGRWMFRPIWPPSSKPVGRGKKPFRRITST
jgi:phosphatidylserine/phosphatidylglycerophosphate/cardiolipin synthase-like enzyme